MTPEKGADNATDANAQASQTDSSAATQAETDAQATNVDSVGEAVNDIERAVEEQAQAAVEAGASAANEATPSNDDPLGFGDQRMADEGEAEEGQSGSSELEAQLAAAESKVAQHWDQLLRLQADMENQRKRALKDIDNARKFALEGFAKELLPVKDSLEMGISAAKESSAEPSKIIEGSELTLKMLAQAFEKFNIVEINPIDEKFNSEFHQAMSMQPVEGKEPNTVSAVMQKGYTLNERLIRPAMVMVAK